MNRKGKLNLTEIIKGDTDVLIETGIKNINTYHLKKPVMINQENQIESEDLKLLYYYHNRLDHYELDKKVQKYIVESEK